MVPKQIQPQEVQPKRKRNLFFGQNRTEQDRVHQIAQQRVGGANKALKAVYCPAYRWRWALRVVAGIADVGEAMIAFDDDALRIVAFDWMGKKAAIYKMSRNKLVEYNVDTIGRYYAVNAWKLYEAVDKIISSDARRAYQDDSRVIIGVEDDTGEEAKVYVGLEGGDHRWLKARVVDSYRIDPPPSPSLPLGLKRSCYWTRWLGCSNLAPDS